MRGERGVCGDGGGEGEGVGSGTGAGTGARRRAWPAHCSSEESS